MVCVGATKNVRLLHEIYSDGVPMRSLKTRSNSYFILDLLRSRGSLYGLEMVKLSDGKLKRGAIYVTLSRLEDRGWLSSQREESFNGDRSIKRLYKLTGEGRRALTTADASTAATTGVHDEPLRPATS